MKVICNQSEIMGALNIALRAVSSKTSLPILECFLLEAKGEELVITSNDMELGIETKILCRVDNPGRIAVNARIFSDIIRKLPEEVVFLETDPNYVMFITCGKAKFKISGVSGEEFPMLPIGSKENAVTISQYTLKDMIAKTIFSISANDNTAIMTGENFEIKNGNLRVVAMDGHRIGIRNTELREEYKESNTIIPGKTLLEISKILSGNMDDKVDMYFMDKQVLFEFDRTVVLSRLIEGKYFPINPMLNSAYTTKITVNKKEISDCLDRALLLVKESEKRPVILDIKNGVMSLSINSSLGTMNEELEIIKDGDDLTICFNPKFLVDAFRAIDDETITLYMNGVKNPCFIRDANDSYIYLILPVISFVG